MLVWNKIRAGEVLVSDNAKTVWESSPVSMAHKLDTFCPMFNSIKAEEEQGEGNISHLLQNYKSFINSEKQLLTNPL